VRCRLILGSALLITTIWCTYGLSEGVLQGLNFIISNNPIVTPQEKRQSLSPNPFYETNELKAVLLTLIRLYQMFVSPEDIPVCNFTPSCSQFGLNAIKKYGIFQGVLMTSDRLQRCNGMGRRYYPVNRTTGRSDDPVWRNALWRK
jgi:hypothetical protein